MSKRSSLQTCYMCHKSGTSTEHVPPKCLFPEGKDLPPGINLRKNLITVPSCDEHNTSKSKDDEYLLFCLSLNIANNNTAFSNFATKIVRAMERNPQPFERFTKNNMPVIAVDTESGEASRTYMIKIDTQRIMRSLEQIARALYFYRYRERFIGRCVILYDFALFHGQGNDVQMNDFLQNSSKQMREYFEFKDHAGDNPEVFKYFLENVEKGHVLRMQFYEASNVFVAFVPFTI